MSNTLTKQVEAPPHKSGLRLFFVVLCVVLAAFCLSIFFFPPTIDINLINHDVVIIDLEETFYFQYKPFLIILVLFITEWTGLTFLLTRRFRSINSDLSETDYLHDFLSILFHLGLSFLPYLIFLPIIIFHSCFLRVSSDLLLSWAIIAHILWLIQHVHNFELSLAGLDLFKGLKRQLENYNRRILWIGIVIIFLFLYSGIAIYFSWLPIGLDGDEPEYVMVSHSLITDQDIMVRNNYERLEYRRFLRHALPFGRTTLEGYPVEGILLSLYLLPFYWLTLSFPDLYLFILRLAVTPLAALLIGEIFLFSLTITYSRIISICVAIVGGLSVPIIFYSPLLFSEITGALLLIFCIRKCYSFNKSKTNRYLIAIGIVLLLWTGAKYVAIAFPLLLWFLYLTRKEWVEVLTVKKHIILSLILITVLIGSYFAFLRYFYHSYSPLATRGGELLEFTKKEGTGLGDSLAWLLGDRISRLPYSLRVACGYLIDQRVGLLLYSPFYVLFISGVIGIMRDKRKQLLPILVILGIYWFMLFWLSYWEGYGPPARYMVPVIPIILVSVGYCLGKNKGRMFFLFLSCSSLFVTIIALLRPHLLFHHTLWRYGDDVNNFLTFYSGVLFQLPDLLPSFTQFPFQWLPAILVMILVILIVFFTLNSRWKSISLRTHNYLWSLIAIPIIFLNLIDPIPLLSEESIRLPNNSITFVRKDSFGSYEWENGGCWTKMNRWSDFSFESDECHDHQLTFAIHSLVLNTIRIRVDFHEINLILPKSVQKNITIKNVPRFCVDRKNITLLSVKAVEGRNLFFQDDGKDGRDLGAFLTFTFR